MMDLQLVAVEGLLSKDVSTRAVGDDPRARIKKAA
jgi:hypothetical protein